MPALRKRGNEHFIREILLTARRQGLLLLLFLYAYSGRASADQWPNNSVSGSVTLKGQPLGGVTVTAYNTNTSTITQVTTTDESGNYLLQLPAAVSTSGIPMDYHIWALKTGYGFYPSVGAGATVIRADHTGDFVGNGATDIAIYLTVIHYQAIPNLANRAVPGPPLTGANFTAYDGSNALVSLARDDALWQRTLDAPGRFADNQDGTVTDGTTGLVWLRDAGCLRTATWVNALTQVNSLATGECGLLDGSAAGDWRLPNINELESLIDVSSRNPAVTPGSPFINVSSSIYWSSTSYFGGEEGSPTAWAIRFSDGRYINDGVSNWKTTAYNQVWAVRGGGAGAFRLQSTGQYLTFTPGDDGSFQSGIPPTFPRWVDEGDGTVADTVTGLVWLKQADCIHQTWEGAMVAVSALANGQCGLTDGSSAGKWRMPTRNEMESLSDRMENNLADFFNQTYVSRSDNSVFQEAIFNNFVSFQYYWTSTPDAADINSVWTVFSCDFGVYDSVKNNIGYTLAIRETQQSDPLPPRSGRWSVRMQ